MKGEIFMDDERRNKRLYIQDLLFYIILPIIAVIVFICVPKDAEEGVINFFDFLGWVIVVIELIGVASTSRRRKDPNYYSTEEINRFQAQIDKEVKLLPALSYNFLIVALSTGAGALWYYSYTFLPDIWIFIMVGALVVASIAFNICGKELYKANVKSKWLFAAGFLCFFIFVMLAISGVMVSMMFYEIFVLLVTFAVIFMFLSFGYFISSSKIKKETKKKVL